MGKKSAPHEIHAGPAPKREPRAEFGTDDREFQLRAERRGNRTGRVYTITYEAEDAGGNVAVAQALVTVDHDRRVP